MSEPPIFSALSTSVRQLHLLLRCIAFAPKADVQITHTGLKFLVEESNIVQGSVILEKKLFTTYAVKFADGQLAIPTFQISLTALLETLQIFGLSETTSSYRSRDGGFSSSYATAFNTPALALSGTCRFSYSELGAPLKITIQEGAVTTTCALNTYVLPDSFGSEDAIPLDRSNLCLKIIMRSAWLHDAIAELAGTNPTALVINISGSSAPYFELQGVGGPFGDSMVEFRPDNKEQSSSTLPRSKRQPAVAETFAVSAPSGAQNRIKQRYPFDLLKKAGRAMALASKVSIRQDSQGVLSMQFMIDMNEGSSGPPNTDRDVGNTGRLSFVEIRFVPLLDEDDEGYEEDMYQDTESQSSQPIID